MLAYRLAEGNRQNNLGLICRQHAIVVYVIARGALIARFRRIVVPAVHEERISQRCLAYVCARGQMGRITACIDWCIGLLWAGVSVGLQEEFKKFDEKIKLTEADRKSLREKRDILLDKLSGVSELPGFDRYDQGSYAMHLGVKPIDDREFDIDVALRFHSDEGDTDPFDYKQAIYDALQNHTEYGAEIKKPCVTVTYQKDGEAAYHVDLVSYVYSERDDKNSQMYISKGKKEDDAFWEKADPVGLVDYVADSVAQGEERDQFRRVVRYIKRWKMRRFVASGHSEPPSIGITLIAAENFTYRDEDDLGALEGVCKAIQSKFTFAGVDENGHQLYDISLGLPAELNFEPGADIFEKMTLSQKTGFKEKIDKLVGDLGSVASEPDLVEQCRELNRIFGDDFPVPSEKDVSKKQMTFIPATSSSG